MITPVVVVFLMKKGIHSTIHLPEEMREELQKPLGQLITENPENKLITLFQQEKPPLVVFVGDHCVREIVQKGFIPDISIIDGLTLRKKTSEITIKNAKIIKIRNPPAMITTEAWTEIERTIKIVIKEKKKSKEPIILFIDGEEDLLVLPVVMESPMNAYVAYGQPHEGVVIIKVTANVKFKFRKLIQRMKVKKNEN